MRLFGFSGRLLGVLGVGLALSACADLSSTRAVPAQTSAQAVPMPLGAPGVPPAGVAGFCLKYLSECTAIAPATPVVALDDRRRQELETIQAKVNLEIAPREIADHAWDYPIHGYGECNEYALEKRRELIALGWPREALLLTAALTERAEGHLVLVARTSAGDLVLDNRNVAVVDWSYLPYRWLVQQSPKSLVQWVSIDTANVRASVASAGRGTLF